MNESAKIIVEIIKKEYLRFKEISLHIYYLLIDTSATFSTLNQIENVYLFGSYAKLIHTEDSEVDLAIILREEYKELIVSIKNRIRKIEKKYKKIIETHFYEEGDFNANDRLIKEIKKNGILLF